MNHLIIPDFQPVPFPAPLPLLKTLLVLGFFLHALPMNAALGGSFMAGVYLLMGKSDKTSHAHRIGHGLALGLPIFVSFAISQGIVPLLFLQLVYGPMYYTSSVLMATPWILLLVVLLTGYYGLYLYKHRHVRLGPWAPWLLIAIFMLFAAVGFLFSSNMTLMLHPETWPALVNGGSPVGNLLNIGQPSLLPRYLHMVLAALAVTGLVVGCYGLYWKSRPAEGTGSQGNRTDSPANHACGQGNHAYGDWLIRQGAGLFLVITLVQLGVGSWFMFALPETIWRNYMSGDPLGKISFFGSMALSVVSLLAMGVAWKDAKTGAFKLGLASALGVVLLMSVMRHLLREWSMPPEFQAKLAAVQVSTQWDLLVVFIISAMGLLVYLGWLAKVTWKAFHDKQAPVEPMIPSDATTREVQVS